MVRLIKAFVLVALMVCFMSWDTAEASGWYRCRCSLSCQPANKRVGVHHIYNALSESMAESMCLSDATDDCLKKYGGTSTHDAVARCQ